jgi:hypothetical protein
MPRCADHLVSSDPDAAAIEPAGQRLYLPGANLEPLATIGLPARCAAPRWSRTRDLAGITGWIRYAL